MNPLLTTHFTGIAPGAYGTVIMNFATAARSQLVYEANHFIASDADFDGDSDAKEITAGSTQRRQSSR